MPGFGMSRTLQRRLTPGTGDSSGLDRFLRVGVVMGRLKVLSGKPGSLSGSIFFHPGGVPSDPKEGFSIKRRTGDHSGWSAGSIPTNSMG